MLFWSYWIITLKPSKWSFKLLVNLLIVLISLVKPLENLLPLRFQHPQLTYFVWLRWKLLCKVVSIMLKINRFWSWFAHFIAWCEQFLCWNMSIKVNIFQLSVKIALESNYSQRLEPNIILSYFGEGFVQLECNLPFSTSTFLYCFGQGTYSERS